MKPLRGPQFDPWRIKIPEILRMINPGAVADDNNGAFVMTGPDKGTLRIIASSGGRWDHVSVSLHYRIPTWAEMEWVKRLFFKDDETAMQLHLPPRDHVNNHPYTLHLWRPHGQQIPLPPKEFV